MTQWKRLTILAAVVGALAVTGWSELAWGQIVDGPGFKAQPRPINYATPLWSAEGTKAVIVYGKKAPWTLTAAQRVQTAVCDWSGRKLELVDDLTVTSDQTWLLADAYRKTPMIVIGNTQDNRLVQALGQRYFDQSNHSWPGGDRYLVRTIFEPFVADVNYIVLSASNEAGMAGATAAFETAIKKLPKDDAATVPFTRIISGTKDKWLPAQKGQAVPKEFATSSRSVGEVADKAGVAPFTAGEPLAYSSWCGPSIAYALGGVIDEHNAAGLADESDLVPAGAIILNGVRAAGGRTHIPFHHYGGMTVIMGIRGLMQADILSPKELNEFEDAMTLSAAYPMEYYYDHIGSDSGFISNWGGRHCMACLLITVNTLDYVLNHCKMDARTRKEVERRYEGCRKACSRYVESFRDNGDTWEMGESTMMQFYSTLYAGFPEVVKNGTLRRMADEYELTTDNLKQTDYWAIPGLYAGLDNYIGASPGMAMASWHGRGLLTAAAFYYDDPQYRWFIKQTGNVMHGVFGSVATRMYPMYWDPAGPTQEPTMYNGVHALPYDKRLYDLLKPAEHPLRWQEEGIPVRQPEPFDKAADRAAFRDGMQPDDAYLFLCTSENPHLPQNNSIARYTDLGEVWLYANSMKGTAWGRSVVSISNGKSFVPVAGTTIEAIGNVGDISAIASKESGNAGSDWTRTIVHLKGHYFVVMDKVQALADDDFNMTCRWRSFNPAVLADGVWTVTAPTGSMMQIKNADPLKQASEYWECDGAARPTVLTQQKQAHLAKGAAETFMNLMYVSGKNRPDEFSVRRVSPTAMLIKGKTAQGEHLALVGVDGNCPLEGVETDAAIYYIAGDEAYLVGATSVKVSSLFKMTIDRRRNWKVNPGTGKFSLSDPGASTPPEPGTILADGADDLTLSERLAKLWASTKDAQAATGTGGAGDEKLFGKIAADKPLDLPLRRIRQMDMTSEPKSVQPLRGLTDNQYAGNLAGYQPTWWVRDNLTISFDFGKPTDLACMRLVSVFKPADGPGDPRFGQAFNDPGDFTFSLELSDDNFQKDTRKIDQPKVTWEETSLYPTWHYALGRLPTWRIDIGKTARYVRLMPHATNKERLGLGLSELEVYASGAANDLTVRAFAADVNGDGSNELAVGTSNKQVAVYDADGKLIWQKKLEGDVFNMCTGDLDADGKSEVMVYETHGEILHRFNGDGTERTPGDIQKALMERNKADNSGGLVTMAVWAPDGPDKKEVIAWSEGCFRVTYDGTTKGLKSSQPRGAAEVHNLYPNEPVVLVTTGYTLDIWSARRDAEGNYIKLVVRPTSGPTGAPLVEGFGWVQGIDLPKHKGLLAANDGGLDWFPITALALGGPTGLPDSKPAPVPGQWNFVTGGVPLVASAIEDGVPEEKVRIYLGREDGFVNVFDLDGKSVGLLNTGETILGMALLGEKGAPRRLAVGTKFGVHVFDADLKKVGSYPIAMTAFAGPGGKLKDRVYTVDSTGKVTVVVIK